jgi:chemotaxis protein CheY-P-specific phosphatase CheC
MSELLHKEELHFANKLLSLALANSAASFAQIANTEIKLQAAEIQLMPIEESLIAVTASATEKLNTLISQVIGDVPAHSYLIINDEDAVKLGELCLPENLKNNTEMQLALIAEIANILTASVVTQLSNFFKVKMLGFVPKLEKTDKQEVKLLIDKEISKESVSFFLKTNFITPKQTIQPDFIWTFGSILIDMIKNISKSEEKLVYLNQQVALVAQYIV